MINSLIKNISKPVEKALTRENEKLDKTIKIIEAQSKVDIKKAETGNNFNYKNPRFWLEVICVIALGYNFLIVPILNDILSLEFQGTDANIIINVLLASMGLGGYRLAEKVINNKK